MAVVFWDVDTQIDFIMPDGKLYVNGAEQILPNLERLTRCARSAGRIVGSVDDHRSDDDELSDAPDFQTTFPPHCLSGTRGQRKVPETAPRNPLWVSPDPEAAPDLAARAAGHDGEIIFRKRRFDVFTNPNVDPVLDALAVDEVVLYGVALDVCNRFAIEGLLARGVGPLSLVLDATRAIDPDRGSALVKDWETRGVAIVETGDVVRRLSSGSP